MNIFGAKFRNFFEIFYDSVTLYVKNIKLRVIWDGLVIIFIGNCSVGLILNPSK